MAASHILRADAALFERPPFVTGASPRQSLPFSPDDPAHFEPDFFDRGGSPTPSECSFDFEEWTASNSAAADSVADLLNALHSPGAGLGRVLQLYEAEQAEESPRHVTEEHMRTKRPVAFHTVEESLRPDASVEAKPHNVLILRSTRA